MVPSPMIELPGNLTNYARGVQSYQQRAGVGARFHSNLVGDTPDSACLIRRHWLSLDPGVASAWWE